MTLECETYDYYYGSLLLEYTEPMDKSRIIQEDDGRIFFNSEPQPW
jgi:hypothetical protein